MNILASAITITWKRNGAYGERLVQDLTRDQWLSQPVDGLVMNHPAWVVSHLNLYGDLAVRMIRGEVVDDPADHAYGQKSRPLADPSAYAKPDELIARWRAIHADGIEALVAIDDKLLMSSTPLERWRTLHPRIGEMAVTLMVKHEAAHLGQLSAWRRAMGLPPVAM